MREILFRGKRKDNGEWVEGFFLTSPEFHNEGIGVITTLDFKNRQAYYVWLGTIGEYTGLTDKNGKKIFEGDVHENNANKYVVKYGLCYDSDRECNYYGYYFQDIKNKDWRECFDGAESKYVNIIGNIHDNPELLEDNNG